MVVGEAMSFPRTDVFVVGGGPAGLAAAIAARRCGLDATVSDAATPPHDKACGEGIMPDGIAAARALGIQLEGAESHPFRGIRFCGARQSVGATFRSGAGLGIKRTALHRTLVEHAERAGVRLLWGERVESIHEGGVETSKRALRTRWIVGADGAQSRVRAWARLEDSTVHTRRFGFRAHFAVAPWSEWMEVHWSAKAQLYLTPAGANEMCVVVTSRDARLRLDDAMPLFPQAARRLEGAAALDAEVGGVTPSRRLKSVSSGRVALVGDASGSVDAITGQGISLAFQQATALADAMARGELWRYEAAHRRIMRKPRWMSSLMLALDGRPWMQRCAFGAMSMEPWLFESFLAMHAGGGA